MIEIIPTPKTKNLKNQRILDYGVSSKKTNVSTALRRGCFHKFRAILDTNGAVVVKYVYDAWGNHLVPDANGQPITDENHIGNLNPFRYGT